MRSYQTNRGLIVVLIIIYQINEKILASPPQSANLRRSPPNAPLWAYFVTFLPQRRNKATLPNGVLTEEWASLAPRQKDEVRKARPAANYSRFYIWKLKRLDGHINSC